MKTLRLLLVLVPFLAAKADITYVDVNAAAGGDGSSWATAFNYLQDALDQTEGTMANGQGDQIWIAKGTYFPDDGANITEGDRTASFLIKDQVELYGGFSGAGTETELSQRDWDKYPTILSGEINSKKKFWSLHVTKLESQNKCTFDGLTITKGNANGQEWTDDSSSGAVFGNGNSHVHARNCIFENNFARTNGAVSAWCQWQVTNCKFLNNQSLNYGGVARDGTWQVKDSVFKGNSASYGGVASHGTWHVKNSIFEENSTDNNGGGGVTNDMGNFDATNCIFIRNTTEADGSVARYSTWSARNCTFVNNQSNYGGSVANEGTWIINNSIFFGNLTLNTDAFGNIQVFSGTNVYSTENSTPTNESVQAFNLIEGGVAAILADEDDKPDSESIIDADPLFVDINDPDGPDDIWGTADDGLKLQALSPAVGVGNTSFLPKDSQDLDGDGDTEELTPVDLVGFKRVNGSGMDLGAYEFGSFKLNLKELYESNSLEAVIVDATPPFGAPQDYSYQWSLNGTPISASQGGDQPTFSINGLAENEGSWTVVISDPETIYSESSFQYRITPAPPVLDLADFYQSERNESVTADATPIGGYPTDFTYQWSFNGTAYPINSGGRKPTRTFTGNSVDNGTWKVVVTNSQGSTSHSFEYRIYVPDPAVPSLELAEFFETQPGEPLPINATPARGYPTNFTFQWYFNGTPIADNQGGKDRVLTLEGTSDDDGTWKIVVSNSEGSDEHEFEYRVIADADGDGLSDYREATFLGTNPALADTDGDGISDDVELAGPTDPVLADTDGDGLVDGDEITKTQTDPVVADSDGDGLFDGEDDQDGDGLTNSAELETHNTDPLLADMDGDGLSDFEEVRLSLNPKVATNTSDIITRLSNLQGNYNDVVADRDSRFVDSDGDGITDVKEEELQTDATEATVFYLQGAYDIAEAQALQDGRDEVTTNPASFALFTTPQYNAIVADRDSRFVDTDADGITDVKEAELQTNTTEATVFYLQEALDFAVNTSRLAGQADVTDAPDTFALFTTPQYNAIVADRDSRFVDTDADGITDVKEAELQTNTNEATVFYLQEALDFAVNTSRLAGQADVTDAPDTFALFTTPQYNAIVADRDSRFVDTDADGITDVKEAELDSDTSEANVFYLKDAYDFAISNARTAGRNDVTSNPQGFELTTVAAYNNILAQRNARPTQAQYNAVIADRDARPTIDEIKDARLGSVVLQPDGANQSIKIRFSIEETDDFRTWVKRDGINEVTVPLEAGSKFYRFALDKE